MQLTEELATEELDWRTEALNEALRAEAYGDNCEDALLREVRRARPTGATLMMYLDRVQLRRFLVDSAGPVTSLTPGIDGFLGQTTTDGEIVLYLGWLSAVWQGETLEAAFVPCGVRSGYVVFQADSEALLASFAKEMAAFVERPAGRCLRYTHGWENAPDMDAEIGKVTWDDIVLPVETAGRLREAVEGFVRNRAAYAALGFAWRRGVLLVGPPGTGKTMVCKAVAATLPEHDGEGITIHPDTGDYVVASNPTQASREMRPRHPIGSFVTMRIGPSPDYALAARIIAGRIAS